jgi:hypothetical protein
VTPVRLASSARRALVSFVLLVVVGGTWALAVPLFAGPDEPSHLRRAAAVARGQLDDVPHEREGYAAVEVPAVLDNASDCYAFDPTVDARCMEVVDPGGTVRVGHTARDYPPLYHGIVGAPSLLADGVTAVYLMRLAGVVAAAAALALAVAAVLRSRAPAPALVGLAATLTPMTLFAMGVVNPSGLAIPAAVAAWCWGYRLVRDAPLARLGAAAAGTGIGLCTLLLLRRDSLLWTATIVVALAALAPRSRWRGLVRARPVHLLGMAVAVAGAVQLAFSTSAATTFAERSGQVDVTTDLAWALDELADKYRHMLGVLGWLDTEIPVVAQTAISVVLVGLVVTALLRAPRQVAVVLVGVIVATAGAVLGFGALRPDYVQGRYLLPLAVGVPLLAGLGLAESRRRLPAAALGAGLGLVALAQTVAFYAVLRRYAVGIDGPWWFPPATGWEPPVPELVLLVVHTLAVGLLALHWYRAGRRVTPVRRAPTPTGAASTSA